MKYSPAKRIQSLVKNMGKALKSINDILIKMDEKDKPKPKKKMKKKYKLS